MSKPFNVDPHDLAQVFANNAAADAAWKDMPAALKCLVAAGYLVGKEQALNQTNVCETAGVSRGSALKDTSTAKPILVAVTKAGAASSLARHLKDVVSHEVLTKEDVRTRDQKIAELNAQLAAEQAGNGKLEIIIEQLVDEMVDWRELEAAERAPVRDLTKHRKKKAAEKKAEVDADE